MHLIIEARDDNLIVRLRGELDHHTSEVTRKRIDSSFFEKDLLNIILDLRELTFMDSSGIGLIMGRYKNAKDRKGELVLVSNNRYIDRILSMSGLLKIIDKYPTIELAATKL